MGYDLLTPYDSLEAEAIGLKKFPVIMAIALHYQLALLYYGIMMPVYVGLVQHAINKLAIISYMEGLADSVSEESATQDKGK